MLLTLEEYRKTKLYNKNQEYAFNLIYSEEYLLPTAIQKKHKDMLDKLVIAESELYKFVLICLLNEHEERINAIQNAIDDAIKNYINKVEQTIRNDIAYFKLNPPRSIKAVEDLLLSDNGLFSACYYPMYYIQRFITNEAHQALEEQITQAHIDLEELVKVLDF